MDAETHATRAASFDRSVDAYERGRPGYPDAAIDWWRARLVAQAFHWFDPLEALDEIARVLRPGGGLGLIWNEDDTAKAPWLDAIVGSKRELSHSPTAAGQRAAGAISVHRRFGVVHEAQFAWTRTTTTDEVVADVASRSYVSTLNESDRQSVLHSVREALADVCAPIEYPLVAVAYWAVTTP